MFFQILPIVNSLKEHKPTQYYLSTFYGKEVKQWSYIRVNQGLRDGNRQPVQMKDKECSPRNLISVKKQVCFHASSS